MHLLRNIFGERIISRNVTIIWPPRSPNLTAPDYFLWDYLKESLRQQTTNHTAAEEHTRRNYGAGDRYLKNCDGKCNKKSTMLRDRQQWLFARPNFSYLV